MSDAGFVNGTVINAPLVNDEVVGVDYDSPSVANVTGATAGIPGTWSPAGYEASSVPATVQALTSHQPPIVANPATAWTAGQYVQTRTAGTTGRATWTGTAWVGGVAPGTLVFDPGEYTVAEVEDYVAAHPDERDAIIAAERAGKNRTTLLTALGAE